VLFPWSPPAYRVTDRSQDSPDRLKVLLDRLSREYFTLDACLIASASSVKRNAYWQIPFPWKKPPQAL